jgi:ribosomal protein S18 acetylase RimI-like enzyme
MSSLDILVRQANGGDFSAILQLWGHAGVTPPSNSDSLDGLNRLMDSAGAVLLVATAHGRIVGSVIGGWDGWRGNIYRLAVVPEYRRLGIARRLVNEVSRALFDKGAERIGALVEHEHSWAVQFWESLRDLGYRPDPQFVRYIADRKNDSKAG